MNVPHLDSYYEWAIVPCRMAVFFLFILFVCVLFSPVISCTPCSPHSAHSSLLVHFSRKCCSPLFSVLCCCSLVRFVLCCFFFRVVFIFIFVMRFLATPSIHSNLFRLVLFLIVCNLSFAFGFLVFFGMLHTKVWT